MKCYMPLQFFSVIKLKQFYIHNFVFAAWDPVWSRSSWITPYQICKLHYDWFRAQLTVRRCRISGQCKVPSKCAVIIHRVTRLLHASCFQLVQIRKKKPTSWICPHLFAQYFVSISTVAPSFLEWFTVVRWCHSIAHWWNLTFKLSFKHLL